MEVYDPSRLNQTLKTLVDSFNQQSIAPNAGKLQLTSHQTDSRTVYVITNSKAPELGVYYTFVDGYLLASASEANLLASIQNKQAGRTLAVSPAFLAKLPADGYTNFSAMFY